MVEYAQPITRWDKSFLDGEGWQGKKVIEGGRKLEGGGPLMRYWYWLLLAVVSIVAIYSTVIRFQHPDWTETELFLNLIGLGN